MLILLPFRQLAPLIISLLCEFVSKGGKHSFKAVVEAGYQPPFSFEYGGGKNETYLHLAIKCRRYHMIPLIMTSIYSQDRLSFESQTPIRQAILKRDSNALLTTFPLLSKESEEDWKLLEELLIVFSNCEFNLVFLGLLDSIWLS